MGLSHIIRLTLFMIVSASIFFILFYRFWFLREPKRKIPSGDCIVSPANGRIVRIIELSEGISSHTIKKGMLGKINLLTKEIKEGYLIVIMMTPLNVHYQKAPFDGKVIDIRYSKGRFMNAIIGSENLDATLENEKSEMMIKTKFGIIKVIQVAGFVARRIVCIARKNQNIKKGQVIGLIKLGSQVCLAVPRVKGLRLMVKEGQDVIDGETVILG